MERWPCGCEDLGAGACRGQKGVMNPLKFQWQGVVSCTTVSTLNSCCVSPDPKIPRCLITVKYRKISMLLKTRYLESVCITFSSTLDFLWVPTWRSKYSLLISSVHFHQGCPNFPCHLHAGQEQLRMWLLRVTL